MSLNGADPSATEAALSGLSGLERVVSEAGALALYVEDGAAQIAEIVRRLDRDQIQVGAISVARPSLDDVFLHATGRRLEAEEEGWRSQPGEASREGEQLSQDAGLDAPRR